MSVSDDNKTALSTDEWLAQHCNKVGDGRYTFFHGRLCFVMEFDNNRWAVSSDGFGDLDRITVIQNDVRAATRSIVDLLIKKLENDVVKLNNLTEFLAL